MQMLELHACMPEESGDRVGQHLMSVGAHRQSKCPCQPKVGQLERVVFPVNQQILGLQVPVQNSAVPQRTASETYRKNRTEKQSQNAVKFYFWMQWLQDFRSPVCMAVCDAQQHLVKVHLLHNNVAVIKCRAFVSKYNSVLVRQSMP